MTKSKVPAARNALRILAFLADNDVPVSAARIRSELDLPRSTTYHLLNEMVEAGFAVHLPDNQTYGLGLAAYAMASAYTRQQPLVRLATPRLIAVAESVGGSGHLSRMAGSEIVYLQEVRAQNALSLITEVGVRLQATRTASGRVMLAHLPEHEVRAAFATSGEVGVLRTFRASLEQICTQGWADEIEEVSRGQSSVAVPVFDHLKRPAAALAVTAPSRVLEGEIKEGTIRSLQAAATELTAKMYGTP